MSRFAFSVRVKVREAIYLRRVVTEYDGIQIAAIVMFDQVVGCVRRWQITCSQGFLVMQRLIQSEDDLKRERGAG